MKSNYGGIDTNIMIIALANSNHYFLEITRTVDHDGKRFNDGWKWNKEILIPITEEKAMELMQEMGVPIKVNPAR